VSQELVTLTIDGRSVTVPKGTLLVEAAKQAGIEIPVFCYHPKLDPAGVCRMCLVQIEKIPKPQTACTTVVAEGMVVHTQNELVADLQKGVLEFLLLNHPLDCPVCDKGGECDLQDHTFTYGPSTTRLQDAKIQKEKSVDLGNFIVLDNERCILCRRCTRFDDQIATEGNLIVEERGHHNYITTMLGESYDSYFSGNTIELCPVGALTSELYRFQARPWDLSKVDSVCTGCSVGCNVKEEYRHGKLLRLTARENEAIDNGWLCDRGRFNYKFVQSEERVTTPLIKKDGQFVEATWSEALALIAAKIKSFAPSEIGFIGGGKLMNEEAYLLQKFARHVVGTNNIDHRVNEQLIASFGAFSGKQTDLSEAGAIMVLDTLPAETAPVMDLRIRRMADRKKAKIALVGTKLPTYRGRHARLQLLPGQVAPAVEALAAAVAGEAIPATAADAETIQQLAALLTGSANGRVAFVWGGDDAATGNALLALCQALKAAGKTVTVLIPGAQHNSRGAEALGLLPNLYPGFQTSGEALKKAWGGKTFPTAAGLSTGEMLEAAASGKLQMLYLVGANLLGTWPNRQLAEAALAKTFVVAHELFLNETAQLADVILPVATIGEKSGSYTTLDGIVQHVKAAKRIEGSAQPDGDIFVALAAALGAKLADSPAETVREINRLAVKLDGAIPGAPVHLPKVEAKAAAGHGDLLLVPVERLYAGGSTSLFDKAFTNGGNKPGRTAHVRPKAEARINPVDAAKHGLHDGEQIELSAHGSAIRLTVKLDRKVVPGTLQAVKGLPEAPVNALTKGGPTLVTLTKLGVEVAG
jgi:NADH-quinone oxidoreductase subunit G